VASRLNPYLNFADNARQAMEFYKSVVYQPTRPEATPH